MQQGIIYKTQSNWQVVEPLKKYFPPTMTINCLYILKELWGCVSPSTVYVS